MSHVTRINSAERSAVVRTGQDQTMQARQRHAVMETGSGPRTLVLAHGYGCDKNMWQRVVPLLEDGFHIVTYDLMGCGGSDLSAYDRARYDTLDGHASDLIAILEEMEIEGAILVGHSVSAMTVALVANRRPDLVSELILVCPSPSFINDGDYVGGFERSDIDTLLETLDANYLGWSSEMAPAIMGTPHMPEMGETLTNSFCQADPEIARHFAQVTFLADHRADVAKVSHRSLVLHCRDDVIVPPEVAAWMQAHMQRIEPVMLDAMGHCPHISYPAETAAAMRAFLSRG